MNLKKYIVLEKKEEEEKENYVETKYGYCFYFFYKGRGFIYNLYVYPEYRKQGKAKELLQYAIKAIKDTGYIGDIYIEAKPKENSISFNKLVFFYKSLGLKIYNKKLF
jgi:ribosomal protein S18 acetylase RimI-like enzyme